MKEIAEKIQYTVLIMIGVFCLFGCMEEFRLDTVLVLISILLALALRVVFLVNKMSKPMPHNVIVMNEWLKERDAV